MTSFAATSEKFTALITAFGNAAVIRGARLILEESKHRRRAQNSRVALTPRSLPALAD
ncbi:MAG: hypothetical protein JO227_12105 [Acetobacteraceae bacterium]|nr:hypothetical protein [Acetobacteraceae bacterium]